MLGADHQAPGWELEPLHKRTWQEELFFLLLLLALGFLTVFNNGYQHPVLYAAQAALGLALPLACFGRREPVVGTALPQAGNKETLFRNFSPHAFLASYLLWNFLTLFWTVGMEITITSLLQISLYAAVFLAVACLTPAAARRLLAIIALLGVAVALIGVAQFLLVSSARVKSVFMNPNPLGAYLVMVALLLFFGFRHGVGGRRSPWPWAGAVLAAVGAILTGSRGSWLAFLAGFAAGMIFLPTPGRGDRIKIVGQGVFLLALAGSIAWLLTLVAPLIHGGLLPWLGKYGLGRWFIQSTLLRDNLDLGSVSVAGRLSFWGVAARMALARPWSGFGLGNYPSAYFLFWPGDRFYSRFAHNHYLQTAAETGLPGLLLLLAFLASLFLMAWQVKANFKERPEYAGPWLGTLAAAAAFLSHSFIDFSWNMPAVAATAFALLGAILSLGGRGNKLPYCTGIETIEKTRWRKKVWLPVMGIYSLAVFLLAGSFLLAASNFYQRKGNEVERSGSYGEAAGFYQRAERVNPWAASYPALVAISLSETAQSAPEDQKMSYFEASVKSLRRAVALSPMDGRYRFLLAVAEWRVNNLPAAEENFRLAARLNGFVTEPYLELGIFYRSQNRLEEAIATLEKGLQMEKLDSANAPSEIVAQQLKTSEVQLHLNLARVFEELNQWNKKKEHLQSVLEIDPGNAVAKRELSRLGGQ